MNADNVAEEPLTEGNAVVWKLQTLHTFLNDANRNEYNNNDEVL